MKNVFLLLKKDVTTYFSSYRRGKKHRDIFGVFTTLMLVGLIYGTFIFVFNKFATAYSKYVYADVNALASRVRELFTMVYAGAIFVGVVVGVRKIYTAIDVNDDCNVLMCQPISAGQILLYKFVKVYFTQILSTALVLIPSAVIINVIYNELGWYYYLILALHCLLVPFVSDAISALIAIPYSAVKRFIKSRFVLRLFTYVLSIAVVFWIYWQFLQVLTTLMQSGDFTMTVDTVSTISRICNKAFIVKEFALMLLGEQVLLSLGKVLIFAIASTLIAYLILKKMFGKMLLRKMEGDNTITSKHTVIKQRSVFSTLINKEFVMILRTPSYAFQYFATAVTCPFMTFICVSLMQQLMFNLLGNYCKFSVSVFAMLMFTVLCNTFCTTNISRDGNMFGMMKTMPIVGTQIVRTKVVFCQIIAEVSVLLSCVVLYVANFVNAYQSLLIFVFASVLSYGQIAFATRKDLDSPVFPQGDNEEVTESNNNVSVISFIGIVLSLVCGVGAIAMELLVYLVFDFAKDTTIPYDTLLPAGFVMFIVTAFSVLASIYLHHKLNKKFYTTDNK